MNFVKQYIYLLFVLLLGLEAQANHISGGNIRYTCMGNDQYQIELKLYSECPNSSLPPSLSVDIIGTGIFNGIVQPTMLNLRSVQDVPLLCPSVISASSCNGGGLPGYQENTYIGIADFTQFPPGFTWKVQYTSCCLGPSVTNINNGSSSPMFIETSCTDGNITCNSSPEFLNMPIVITCDDTPLFLSNTAFDADGDSIVYRLTAPITDPQGTLVTYTSGLSANTPLYTNSGVNINPATGQLNFIPTAGVSQVALIEVTAYEYRNGTLIGSTNRLLQVIVTSCNNNNLGLTDVAEVINSGAQSQGTNTTFQACPGEDLHFQITVEDSDLSDSLILDSQNSSLFRLYPNASISFNYPDAGAGNFNKVIADIVIPNVQNNGFTLVFRDEVCPIPSIQSFDFLIVPDSNCASIIGRVAIDSNNNCLVSPVETAYSDVIVVISKGNFITYATPNANGDYAALVDTGSYNVSISPIHPYWNSCASNSNVTLSSSNNIATVDFPMSATASCPFMTIEIGASSLVHCGHNHYTVNYCNNGTADAVGSYIDVILDTLFVIDSTTLPITNNLGSGFYQFNLGTVPAGFCGSFRIYGTLDPACDTTNRSMTHCAFATISPDTTCINSPLWTGADLQVEAQCSNDSVRFRIVNTGSGAMSTAQSYWVIEDDLIFHSSPPTVLLPSGAATQWVAYPATGATYRTAINQEPNHPWGTEASATVEGCQSPLYSTNPVSTGFVNIFSLNDNIPSLSIDCQQNVSASVPNDKQGFPMGYGSHHYINQNDQLEYRIRFQNTGTTTASNLVIVDTLSNHLDPTSILPSTSSHHYTWRMLGPGIVEFRFNNINLPDSGSNLANSYGFVDFRIDQKANTPLGTVIYNDASIYFDFYPPTVTNQTHHTVGANFIQVTGTDYIPVPNTKVNVYPNPFETSTTIEIESEQVYQDIQLQVFDATGRLIETVHSKENSSIILHRRQFAQGIYFYRLMGDDQLINSGKLIVR